MSKDAKKKAARHESFKDSELVRMNALIGQLNRDVCLITEALEKAGEYTSRLLADRETDEAEIKRLKSELTAAQDCAQKYLTERDDVRATFDQFKGGLAAAVNAANDQEAAVIVEQLHTTKEIPRREAYCDVKK